jgi:hypothetical protein
MVFKRMVFLERSMIGPTCGSQCCMESIREAYSRLRIDVSTMSLITRAAAGGGPVNHVTVYHAIVYHATYVMILHTVVCRLCTSDLSWFVIRLCGCAYTTA